MVFVFRLISKLEKWLTMKSPESTRGKQNKIHIFLLTIIVRICAFCFVCTQAVTNL